MTRYVFPPVALALPVLRVRESVVEVLGGLDDPRAISLLLQARGDASPLVREEAAGALARLGSARSEKIDEISFISSD